MAMRSGKRPPARGAAAPAGKRGKRVRWGVVGLGHISQSAALPGFRNAKNAELAALVSDDPEKLKKLGRKYGAGRTCGYEGYDDLIRSGGVDALYIGLPNSMHGDYAVRALRAGVHVLCEKPMAVTERECEDMLRAAEEGGAKLMIAYRLHLEKANLDAIDLAQSGKLGELRSFSSVFCMQVKEDNIRVKKAMGGGPLYDLGIYCVNAARYLFRDEPVECLASRASKPGDPRFREVPEMVAATLRFPGERLATFLCGFGGAATASYRLVGTKGVLSMENAYEYQGEMRMQVQVGGKEKSKSYPQRDQFGAEIAYFSDCVLTGKDPEPSGAEGLADIRIIRALNASIEAGKPVALDLVEKRSRPGKSQEVDKPAVKEPDLVKVEAPSRD